MTKNFRLVGAALIATVIGLIYASMCYGPITGTVVDSETGKPIEGAVVLVEWTRTKGVGLSSTESYKVIEVITDGEGMFKLPGVYNPLVNPPRVTVYKKEYAAWNNQYVFPSWAKRSDFRWSEKVLVRLERFKKEYSKSDHVYFLHSVTHWGKLINEAYRWEELEKEKLQ